ncbi:SMI1/KNR4 family protein [Pseudomonas sessilinigenes]|uniref:SMI1/KNR4 family protein n=1 Tax=Pseudomonas sessilinigenes TaxID=658629 RepID=A0ABX8MX90_9PSED|nr:SMI1/KNR4 family protein [Pseudomonas sessilinigenes]AZC23158.1 hypothetical protein C4K39_1465 [Pseudomonas sessilinigenes]QXH42175.1 SMI1/KNR4 family protein [Pseudomonas sessilinigenes]
MGKVRVLGTTQEAIHAAETQLGLPLPKSFADWLLANNGRALGALVVLPVFDARDPRKTWDSIVRYFQGGWQRWQENFGDRPEGCSRLLPFAEFGTGDCYCFDYATLGETGEPVVVLWSHETGQASVVADSYAAFLASPDRPG